MRQHLWDYYGQLNERRLGINPKPEEIVIKPDALVRFEKAQSLGVPYVTGGLLDQPYIWMEEHGAIKVFLEEKDAIEKHQAAQWAAANPGKYG